MATLTHGTWVLLADGEKALLLQNTVDALSPGLEVVRKTEQENPSDYDQSANRPGRKPDTGIGHVSAMEDTDWHELAKERFAQELADILYKRAHRGDFDRIVLVAAPDVLGDLRAQLHKTVREKIVAEIPKNLCNHPLDTVEKLLKSELDPML